jgi:Ca2+-binding EF-hand superfamily protein
MSLDVTAVSAAGASPVQTMTGPSAAMPTRQKMSALFDQIDTAGSGRIDAAQLQQAYATLKPPAGFQSLGPSALMQHLDPAGSGSVSRSHFVNVMSSLSNQLRSAAVTDAGSAAAPGTQGGAYINTQA